MHTLPLTADIITGSLDEDSLSDMITYAHETQHEKILRGLSLGQMIIMSCKSYIIP